MPRTAPFGYARHCLVITVPFSTVLSGTSQVNLMLSKTLGYACELERIDAVTTTVGTGTSASRTLNVRKGNATGTIVGTITLVVATQGTLGVVNAGTVSTGAAYRFTSDTDTLTVESQASGSTGFSAGGLDLILTFRSLAQRAS